MNKNEQLKKIKEISSLLDDVVIYGMIENDEAFETSLKDVFIKMENLKSSLQNNPPKELISEDLIQDWNLSK